MSVSRVQISAWDMVLLATLQQEPVQTVQHVFGALFESVAVRSVLFAFSLFQLNIKRSRLMNGAALALEEKNV